MRKENSDFNTKFISEAGSYLVNADYFAFVELKDYACYVIADGIDPDEKKESAKLAVTTVITEFSDAPGMSAGKLRHYLKSAHEALLRESDEIRLEASILILLTDYKKAMWGHAGNSRLCWIKNGEIRLSTKDTSLTQRMADQEEVALDQISAHEERNNLYTYLGQPGRFTPVISAKHKLEDGDIFILMTRGVWENVGNAEIIDAVDGVSKAEDVCTGLEDVILSQRLDIIENYTIASVFINKIYQNPKAGRNKKILRIVFSVCLALGMLLLSLSIAKFYKNKSNMDKIERAKAKGIEYLQEMKYELADEQFSNAYDIAGNVKPWKGSKTEKKVFVIERYDKMVEDLEFGLAALDEPEYKKALAQFDNAIRLLTELRDEYGEDISSFEQGLNAYQKFAKSMLEGSDLKKQSEFVKAKESFTNAAVVMDDINDTIRRDVANAEIKFCDAQANMADGEKYEKLGDANLKDGEYENAYANYVSARDFYALASEGDASAKEKVMAMEIKIGNANTMIENRTDQQKIAKAEEYVAQGDKLKIDKKKKEALELYEKAKELYSSVKEIDVSAEKKAVMEKINNIDADPTAELLSALEYLSQQNYNSAIDALTRAHSIYDAKGDTDSAKSLQRDIDNIRNLMNNN